MHLHADSLQGKSGLGVGVPLLELQGAIGLILNHEHLIQGIPTREHKAVTAWYRDDCSELAAFSRDSELISVRAADLPNTAMVLLDLGAPVLAGRAAVIVCRGVRTDRRFLSRFGVAVPGGLGAVGMQVPHTVENGGRHCGGSTRNCDGRSEGLSVFIDRDQRQTRVVL